jgi:aminoglycoside phosphotransferase (APT) family kinase protein
MRSFMAQTTDLKKIAEGREAEMFAWGEGKILRLLRGSGPAEQERLQTDMLVLKGAHERGLRVPAVYEAVEQMGRPGVVMERIEGADLLTVIARQPWKVWWVAGVSGRAHAGMHEVVAPPEVQPTRERIVHALTHSPHVPKVVADAALDALAELPDGDRLSHGDFHPGNILTDGDEPVIIDWSNVTCGDPAADVARTLVILGSGSPPPGTPLPLRVMALFGRRLLTSAYLRSYRRAAPLDMDLVRRWEAVRLADRLADSIPEERASILRLLSKAFNIPL